MENNNQLSFMIRTFGLVFAIAVFFACSKGWLDGWIATKIQQTANSISGKPVYDQLEIFGEKVGREGVWTFIIGIFLFIITGAILFEKLCKLPVIGDFLLCMVGAAIIFVAVVFYSAWYFESNQKALNHQEKYLTGCINLKKDIDANRQPLTDQNEAHLLQCQEVMNGIKDKTLDRIFFKTGGIPLDLTQVKG